MAKVDFPHLSLLYSLPHVINGVVISPVTKSKNQGVFLDSSLPHYPIFIPLLFFHAAPSPPLSSHKHTSCLCNLSTCVLNRHKLKTCTLDFSSPNQLFSQNSMGQKMAPPFLWSCSGQKFRSHLWLFFLTHLQHRTYWQTFTYTFKICLKSNHYHLTATTLLQAIQAFD